MFRPLRTILIPLAAALLLTGCGSSAGSGPDEDASPPPSSSASPSPAAAPTSPSSPSSPAATSLTIEFRAEGTDVTDTYSLECDGAAPVGTSGTPDPAAACAALAGQGAEAFAPADPNIMCTQITKGPQRAQVSGTIQGVAVDREFSVNNGCEISRWESLTGLLAPAGAAG
ncbi:hypothetical protein OL239_00080 [Arthrobacter sp. ATA002]|uniref:hypothetical protein n=1 Tax=Arthrobacter sp. ATA002 TaxID=2991715 RepID=UPI0022A722AD|nr:hypothetical protein [Arthrobacter sp. ATA002]WAP51827.1 hypothetical protein OL239_00080 [Arthrobacter sp. ATA002]